MHCILLIFIYFKIKIYVITDIRNERFDMGKRLLQLLLNGLIFIKATAFFFSSFYKNDLPSGYRLPNYVIPEHYNIQLEPFFEIEGKSFNFSGRCEVYIKIISPTWYISLHAKKPRIKIQKAIVIDIKSSYPHKPTSITCNNEIHILIFHFNYKLSNGQYLLNISFTGHTDIMMETSSELIITQIMMDISCE